jgi:DNA-directed RNA polymerase specialized sigma24 family protein
MKLPAVLEEIGRRRRYVAHDHIRNVFGDYHNALHWLALFLVGNQELAEASVIDACTIATINTPGFHEWLVLWAVRATFQSALQNERMSVAELASKYERGEPLAEEQAPLLAEQFRQLVRHSELIHSRLDVLSRFVLVMRGIAKDSSDEIAAELGVSRTAVVQAYRLAVDLIDYLPWKSRGGACFAVEEGR